MSYTADRERFIAQFVSERAPKDYNVMRRLEDARTILRHATTHGRLAVEDCNRGLTDAETLQMDKAEKHIAAVCLRYRFRCIFGGDPRGFTVC